MEGTSLIVRSMTTMAAGEGGSFSAWLPTASPILSQAKVGAAKLILNPGGFAFPHYSDSYKVAFVLQGNGGKVGMVLPQSSKEKVLQLQMGVIIAQQEGSLSWWFNGGNEELVVIFLGDSSNAHIPGQFSLFIFAGVQSMLQTFSTEVIAKAYDLTSEEARELATSQTGRLIIKLDPESNVSNVLSERIIDDDYEMAHPGSMRHLELAADAIMGPSFCVEPPNAVRVMYVARGSGKVEIVGLNGVKRAEEEVKEEEIVVVPKLLPFAAIAGADGLEFIILTTSLRSIIKDLAGKGSIWRSFNPGVIQAALNLSPELEETFLSRIGF